jgi:hypothetical protein
MRSDEVLKRAEEGMKESNKILIKELIQDLEEKGISPVIALDGEVKKLTMVCESELKDFTIELKKFGMEKSDFCLLCEGAKTKNRKVIIIHKKSAKLKTYNNENSLWIADFHRDLENKFFTN